MEDISADMNRNRGQFELRFWGVRGTVPSPGSRTVRYGGNTVCVEVLADGHETLILDAGTGIRLLGQEMKSKELNEASLLLTHCHSDHVIGLPHFLPLFDSDFRLSIWGGERDPRATFDLVRTILSPPLFPSLPAIVDRISVEQTPDGSFQIGDQIKVRKLFANHPGGAFIYRIESHTGAAFAFAPDNELCYRANDAVTEEWRSELIKGLSNTPILIHDAMWLESELTSRRGWGHSSPLEATKFAVECGAEILVLIHHHPDRSDEEIDRIVEECNGYAASIGSALNVVAAWEGLTLNI